ncbi:MAG: VOC family protein [Anaerolineaceae bacterium]
MTAEPETPVLQMRVAFTSRDYERLLRFYCDGLGLEPAELWHTGRAHAALLEMGSATLEIFNEAQADMVDEIEAGRRVSGQIRFALQVPDLPAAMRRMLDHGAVLVHEPVLTPWGDTNVRLQDPDGMQITLFQSAGSA